MPESPPVGCPGFEFENVIPGHALHGKGLQRQSGVGPLFSSQGRRAAIIPLINRSSAARRVPRFGSHRILFVRAAEESSRNVAFGALGVEMEGRPLGAPLRRADPPCPAVPGPPVGCPGHALHENPDK